MKVMKVDAFLLPMLPALRVLSFEALLCFWFWFLMDDNDNENMARRRNNYAKIQNLLFGSKNRRTRGKQNIPSQDGCTNASFCRRNFRLMMMMTTGKHHTKNSRKRHSRRRWQHNNERQTKTNKNKKKKRRGLAC